MLTFDLIGLIFSLLFVTVFLPLGWMRKYPPHRIFVTALIFLYFLFLIDVTLFPIPLNHVGDYPREPNLVPFATIRETLGHSYWRVPFENIGGNFILLMPFGFFLALKSKRNLPFWHMLGVAFLVTLCIEFLQLFISHLISFRYRTFDVDDLMLNTLGFLIAYPIGRRFHQKISSVLQARE